MSGGLPEDRWYWADTGPVTSGGRLLAPLLSARRIRRRGLAAPEGARGDREAVSLCFPLADDQFYMTD